jgi:hypothetical protein
MRHLVTLLFLLVSSAQLVAEPLAPAPSPVDNPLKGLVPYSNPAPGRFPHSMEFSYVALSDLMYGMDDFRWEKLEKLLDDVASRGNQTVFRVFLEYPNKKEGIPPFLEAAGLKVHVYQNTNTAPFPPAQVRTPDYESKLLHEATTKFIAALGAKYDDDPRIAYITAGLLGTWGEWHTYPKDELWASKATQKLVLDAYAEAFHKTPVLLRYPAGDDHWDQVANAALPFGYHDDSFAWATLDTGKKKDDWHFVPALKKANAQDKWQQYPIGGEIRPEVWGKLFDKEVKVKGAQNFEECVQQTHASWLMDSGMFEKQAPQARYDRAIEQVRKLGYDFYVRSATLQPAGAQLTVECEVINQGVAPFYRDWKLELGLLSASGEVRQTWPVDWKLTGLLPRVEPRTWSAQIEIPAELASDRIIALRVIHPLAKGKSLRFANASQDQHAPGWLTLGTR